MQFIIDPRAEVNDRVELRNGAGRHPKGTVCTLAVVEAGQVHASTVLTATEARALAGALLVFADVTP